IFVLCKDFAIRGTRDPGQVKHVKEPLSPNMFGAPGACSEPHSALMFHPNVGTPLWPSVWAPVNSSVDTGRTAKTLSFERSACTSCRLLLTWSSRSEVSLSLRP